MKMTKPIEKLTIMNDFLFDVIMRQEQFCKPLLEYILKVKIRKIVYIREQESLKAGVPKAKSIRMDVYIEDDAGTVYDLEVQTTNKRNLGKRTRYYQSMIDTRVLEKGQDYNLLKKALSSSSVTMIRLENRDTFTRSEIDATRTSTFCSKMKRQRLSLTPKVL